jgi:hypothetical protein
MDIHLPIQIRISIQATQWKKSIQKHVYVNRLRFFRLFW